MRRGGRAVGRGGAAMGVRRRRTARMAVSKSSPGLTCVAWSRTRPAPARWRRCAIAAAAIHLHRAPCPCPSARHDATGVGMYGRRFAAYEDGARTAGRMGDR